MFMYARRFECSYKPQPSILKYAYAFKGLGYNKPSTQILLKKNREAKVLEASLS